MYIEKFNIKKSKPKIIIFSGAGISAPSGISTFRDKDGLWENHKIDEVCNEGTWKNNFKIVHDFYNERRNQLENVEPNIAHKVVSDIIYKYGEDNVINITQNVDNLFERANVTNTLHVHGELTKMQCENCGHQWNIGNKSFDIKKDKCPNCDSVKNVRPKIVFFGGSAPMYKYMSRAFEYASLENSIVVVIGTMGNVVPIDAYLKDKKAKKILCNMEKSKYINEKNYDNVYYESITTVIDKIEKNIEKYWTN